MPRVLLSAKIDNLFRQCEWEKARQLLGFTPHTAIEDGLLATVDWYRVAQASM